MRKVNQVYVFWGCCKLLNLYTLVYATNYHSQLWEVAEFC